MKKSQKCIKISEEIAASIYLFLYFQHLWTSSPFSDYLSLDMPSPPPGEPPTRPRPDPGDPGSGDVTTKKPPPGKNFVWVVGLVVAFVVLGIVAMIFFVLRK